MQYIIIEKAKPYTRVKRGKLERVTGYARKPRYEVGSLVYRKLGKDRWQVLKVTETDLMTELTNGEKVAAVKASAIYDNKLGDVSMQEDAWNPGKFVPSDAYTYADQVEVVPYDVQKHGELRKAKPYQRTRRGKFEQVKGYPGQEPSVKEASGVSAERKEAAPFTKQKRSSPGDGLKSLKDYPTVHDLGHAVYKELDVIQMWSKPTGFGGFAVGYIPSEKSMIISYNEPRELRHPEDYNFPEYELSNARAKYNEVDEQVHKVVEKLKGLGVRVVVAYDSSGTSWIVNRPKESDFVKSEVKGYTRVRQGKMERVQPFQRVGEAHTPTAIEKIKGVIQDLIGKIKGWKKSNKGFLTKEQRKYIHKRVNELKRNVGKQDLTIQQRMILRNALSQMRKELEVKSKLAERGQTLPLPKKKLSKEELEAKRKKGYAAYLSRKREEKKGKETKPKKHLSRKREETKPKKHPGIPPKGLKKEEFTGLIEAGYSRREIVKMGSNAAKAAYWNNVKPDEHEDVQSNIAELHHVISKN